MMDSILLINLPSSPIGMITAILLILGFGFLYIKAVDHLFKNSELSNDSKLLWALFMAVLPIITPTIYLLTRTVRPAN